MIEKDKMFNSPNDCFISSPSSPSGLIFNRQNHNSRYHPYGRIPTSYYQNPNELEIYSYDNNNSTIQNYDHSLISYDYNLPWTTSSSSIDNEMGIDGQTINGANLGGTGRVKFLETFFIFERRKLFIHLKVPLVVLNDVFQLIKKSAVGHSL